MNASRTDEPALTWADCARHVHDVVFGGSLPKDHADRHLVGIELEWLTSTFENRRLDIDRANDAVAALSPFPSGSRLTIEPGGQLELSSAPGFDFDQVCDTTANELFALDQWCTHRGIELTALGGDPDRRPERVLQHPRYAAMEQYFDSDGPAGRTMMCNTASIQINVGLGPAEVMGERWQIANRIGPVLLAAFANSPLANGGPTGWASNRLRTWWTLDPSRSGPVPIDGDPAAAWLHYALDARVMFIRCGEDCVPMLDPISFRRWMEHGHELGRPTIHDFVEHLTTLFPPVRPRGWFEIRYIDALPTPFWHVAAAVAYAAIVHPDARARIGAVLDATGADELWVDAAQLGLGHPALEVAARTSFASARSALPELGVSDAITELVDSYVDRWVVRARCPADDRLDVWRRTGELFPLRESPVPYGREVRSRR